jgi:hypothetical protein
MPSWTPKMNFTKRFWIGCAITLLSFSFFVVMLLQVYDARSLTRDGVPAQATVIDTRIVENAPSGTNTDKFHLTYRYPSNGQTRTHERSVPETFFNTHPTGTVWTITVHPDDTSRHDLFEGQTRTTAWSSLVASLLLAVFGISLALSSGNLTALKQRLQA